MVGFEASIASNKRQTVYLVIGFFCIISLLGWVITVAVDPGLAWLVLAGCLGFAVISAGTSYWFSSTIITKILGARPAEQDDYHERYLIDSISGLVLACGLHAIPRAYVIDSPALNSFSVGRNPNSCTIAVTTGMLETLSREELEAVIAHELAHVYNQDTLLRGVAAILVGGIALACGLIWRIFLRWGWRNGIGWMLLLVGIALAVLAPFAARLLNAILSRKREFLADATAISFTRNPQAMISALSRLAEADNHLPEASAETAINFIVDPRGSPESQSWLTSLNKTHPSIQDRIAALKNS